MNTLAMVLGFLQSLVPVIFPKNEFKPKRAVAVVILVFALLFAVDHFGNDTIEDAIDHAEQIIELTEE
jgi:hypothetical protein